MSGGGEMSIFRTVQAVLGLSSASENSESHEDMAKLNPFHVIVVGICLALIFVLGLIALVNWVVAQPITL